MTPGLKISLLTEKEIRVVVDCSRVADAVVVVGVLFGNVGYLLLVLYFSDGKKGDELRPFETR